MERIELGACGPLGGKLSRESFYDLIVMAVAGGGFIVTFSRFWRVHDSGAALLFGIATVALAAFIAWEFLRMLRRRDDWGLSQAGVIGFISTMNLHEKVPKDSPWVMPAALLPLIPAALLLASYVRMIRRADELQRRMVYEALAFAYVVMLGLVLVGAAVQQAGVGRLPWIWIAGMLVLSWTVGLVIAKRRYGP